MKIEIPNDLSVIHNNMNGLIPLIIWKAEADVMNYISNNVVDYVA